MALALSEAIHGQRGEIVAEVTAALKARARWWSERRWTWRIELEQRESRNEAPQQLVQSLFSPPLKKPNCLHEDYQDSQVVSMDIYFVRSIPWAKSSYL